MALKNVLLNHLVINGNKQTSEKLFLKSIKFSQKRLKKDHKDIFKSAIILSSPIVSLKTISKGRKQSKEFPFVLHKRIRISLAIKLILHIVNKTSKTSFSTAFSNEMTHAAQNTSSSNKSKQEIHNNAFLVRKYANFRWF